MEVEQGEDEEAIDGPGVGAFALVGVSNRSQIEGGDEGNQVGEDGEVGEELGLQSREGEETGRGVARGKGIG